MPTFPRIIVAVFGLFVMTASWAQNYPSRPVTFVIPYPPGGSIDVTGRLVAAELEKRLGQRIVVVNRPGASGIIGARDVARAAPDGYTIMYVDLSPLVIHPHIYKSLGYDPLKDFAPVTLVSRYASALVVNDAVPAKTIQEFVALAKSRSEPMNYATLGPGSPHQLSMERLKLLTGMTMTPVAYPGGAAVSQALAAGQVQAMIVSLASVASVLASGAVRPLAVAATARLPSFPDIPTFDESGLKGFEVYAWFGLVMPAGTDRSIIARLNDEVRQALATTEIKERFSKLGAEPISDSPDEFAAYIKQEYAVWGKVIKDANIQPVD